MPKTTVHRASAAKRASVSNFRVSRTVSVSVFSDATQKALGKLNKDVAQAQGRAVSATLTATSTGKENMVRRERAEKKHNRAASTSVLNHKLRGSKTMLSLQATSPPLPTPKQTGAAAKETPSPLATDAPPQNATRAMAHDMAHYSWLGHGSLEPYRFLHYVVERHIAIKKENKKRRRMKKVAGKRKRGETYNWQKSGEKDGGLCEPDLSSEFLQGSSTRSKSEACLGYSSASSGRTYCLVPARDHKHSPRSQTVRLLCASQQEVKIQPTATSGRIVQLADGSLQLVESYDSVPKPPPPPRSYSFAAQFDIDSLPQLSMQSAVCASAATPMYTMVSRCWAEQQRVEEPSGLRGFFARWGRK